MRFAADLHMHGKFARGCSKDLVIANMEKYARIKGIGLLGTGDFTHPGWFKHVTEELKEDDNGILRTKTDFPFIWQSEISLVYTQDGKGRRVHNVVLAPSKQSVEEITEWLLTKGRIDYDGRPIFKIPCPEFVESLKDIDERIEIIPAHAWTPWFSVFGSKSGFDSLKDAFQDTVKHIHAIETGLSSDPLMNWRIKNLDTVNLVSFSDAHSFWPWRIGRELTVFDMPELTFGNVVDGIKGNGLIGTIETDPAYGKYHLDGHRKCDVCFEPKESLENQNLCPKCGKTLVLGVLHRVEALATRDEGYVPENARGYTSLLPLSELISMVLNCGTSTKKVWNYYNMLTQNRSEIDVLLFDKELKTIPAIRDAIIANRNQELVFKAGYDGEYGVPVQGKKDEIELSGPGRKSFEKSKKDLFTVELDKSLQDS